MSGLSIPALNLPTILGNACSKVASSLELLLADCIFVLNTLANCVRKSHLLLREGLALDRLGRLSFRDGRRGHHAWATSCRTDRYITIAARRSHLLLRLVYGANIDSRLISGKTVLKLVGGC